MRIQFMKRNILMGNATKERIKKIPFGVTPQEIAERRRIWAGFDVNGNGYLSLAEIDKGIRDVLNIPQLFDSKPAIMRAYQAAKTKMKAKSPHSDDYVTKGQFRYLLICLRQYYEYWIEFEEIDISGDRRLSVEEFKRAVPLIQKWGIKLPDPVSVFNSIKAKANANEHITFTDFCDWAVREHLNLHADSSDHGF